MIAEIGILCFFFQDIYRHNLVIISWEIGGKKSVLMETKEQEEMEEVKDVSEMKVVELKAELSKRGLPTKVPC